MTATTWLSVLVRASIEGSALLLVIWAVTRLWPRMPAGAHCALWWLGSLRMISGLMPVPTIAVPLWTAGGRPPLPTPMIEIGQVLAGVAQAPTGPAPPQASVNVLAVVLIAIWTAGILLGAVLMTRRLIALRRAWRSSRPFDDPRLARWQNEWAVVLGRGRLPDVRVGPDVQVPVAIGILRPGVLLPESSAQLSDDALRVVLAHEMGHVRRGDLLLGWVPAAAQLVFWFHPLVRFAVREYLAAREQVCDGDALRDTAVSPRDYGALLVDYGVGPMPEVPGAACCGSRGSRELKRRLDMLSRTPSVPWLHRAGATAVTLAVLALAFVPIRFVSATESSDASSKAYEAAKEAWRADKSKSTRAYDKVTGDKDRTPFSYAIKISGRKGTRGSVSMEDMGPLRQLDWADETAVYFRSDDEKWISKDAEVIERVMRALEPEDRFAKSRRQPDFERKAFDREQARLEERFQEIQLRKEGLDQERDELFAEMMEKRKAGESTESLKERVAMLEEHRAALEKSLDELAAGREELARGMATLYRSDKASYVERDRIHQRILEEIHQIWKQAVEDGRAERFNL